MKTKIAISFIGVLLITLVAQGQPTIFFGEDVSPYPPDGLNNVPRPGPLTNSFSAAASFAAHLPGVLAEKFETYPAGNSPMTIAFGTNIAALSGSRQIETVADPTRTFHGAFPVSGTNMLLLPAQAASFFALDFSAPQAAFGFFGTDVGETAGIIVEFISTTGARTSMAIPVTQPQGSGGAFFFGIINKSAPFTRIEFTRAGNQGDGFGFDDMTIATPEQVAAPPLNIRISEVELSWVTLTNESYRVEYRTALSSNIWSSLGCVAGDGTTKKILDEIVVGEPRRFYRLVITNCVPGF